MKKILLSLLVSFVGLAAYSQVQVGSGTSTTSGYPVNCYFDFSYSEQIYLQSEINAAGLIDTISFYFDGGGSTSSSNDWTIYLGHTTKSDYSSSTDWITSSSLTQVFSGTVSIPTSGWFKIGLNTPFNYNNVDNLVVAVDENSSGYDGSGRTWRVTNSGSTRAIYSYQDGTNLDPLSPGTADGTSSNLSNIIFGGITQSCPSLSGVFSFGLSSDSVNLSWTTGTNDIEWYLEYGADGFTQGTGTFITSLNDTVVLNGFTQNTDYDVYVRGICSVGDSSVWVGPYSFTTLQTCPAPSSLSAFAVGVDTVNVTWLNGLNDSAWIIEYGIDGFIPGTGTIVATDTNINTIYGLTQNTDYDIYVRSVCTVGDTSLLVGPHSFTTLCGNQALPYLQDYSSFLPDCWEEAEGELTVNSSLIYGSSNWTYEDFANNFSGSQSAIVNVYDDDQYDWLISPSFDLGNGSVSYQVEFDIALTEWNDTDPGALEADDTIALVISLDNGVTWSDINVINTWDMANQPSGIGAHVTFDLSAYTGVVKFGLYGQSAVDVSADNDLFIDNFQVREIPSCADPVGLTTYNVTYDSIALTWTAGVNDSAWIIEYDTTGFTLGTGTIVNASNDSLVLTPINELYTYDIYLKGVCTGGDSSIWLGPITVSTPSSCPKPTAFTSYGVGIDTAALKWTTGPNDSVWLVEYGVDGFTPGTGITVVSNNDSLVVTGLSGATDYDFYLRGVCTAGDTGVYVGPLSRTTDCPVAFTPAYNQDFSSYIPDCWSEAEGTLTDSTTFTSTTTSYWAGDGFGNVGSSGSARIELYSTYADKDWLISPSFDLGNGSTTYQLEFDVALTYWNSTSSDVIRAGDTVALLISEDNGTTWSDTNIMMVWDENTNISNTGDRVKIRLTGYTDTVKFAFYAEKTVSGGDVNFYVDNFDVIVAPTCPEGDSLMVLNYGFDTATLTWNPGLFDSTWIIEYDTTGFTLGTGNTHLANNDTTAITGLTAVTTYDFYLRSVCTAGDSSTWVGPISVTTKAECPAPTTISDFLLARDSNNITWVGDLADSLYFIEWDSTGFTLGTGNMVTQAEDTIVLNGLGANTTYDFYVRTLCKSNDTSEWVGPFTFTTIESCPVVSSISEFNTTKDSTNITWVSGQYDSVWLIEYDTVGFTLGTGNMVTSTNDTLGINGLNPDTDYQFYVRSICTAGDTSVLVGPVTVTTLESCPSVDSLFAYGTTVNSTNVSWNNGFYDSSWIVEYDVVGFTPGTGNVMSSANDTVNITGLTDATMYDVYVRSICTVGDTSELVGPLTFVTSIANPSACGLNFDIPDNTCGTTGNEYIISVTSAIGTQLGTDVVLKEVRTIITHEFTGDIDLRLVSPSGDTVELSTDNGGSGDDYGDTTGGCVQYTAFNMEAFTNITSGSAPFIGSYIPEGDFNDFNNNSSPIGDWKLLLCDDANTDFGALQFIELVFDLPLTCPRPDAIQAYDAGKDSVIVSWTAGANDSVWVVEYGPTGYTQGTGTEVGVTNDTAVIYGLSADTEYDFYVKGVCHVGDSSIWVGPTTETTLALCDRVDNFVILSSTDSSIRVGWDLDTVHSSYIVEYGPVGYTPGTGTSLTANFPTSVLTANGLTSSTEYDFYIKSVCNSGDTSVWDGPYAGDTDCSFLPLPWSESFENVTPVGYGEVPLCMIEDGYWETKDLNDTYNRAPRTGSNYITTEYGADDWLFTPKFNLDTAGVYEFSFWYVTDTLTGWNEVSAHVGTDQTSTAMTTVLTTELNPTHGAYQQVKGIFKPTSNGVYAFGVYVDASFSPYYLSFDDFNVRDTTQFVSVDELTELSQFNVYPNPNNGEFVITNEGNSLNTTVKILDLQGRVVYNKQMFFSFNDRKEINLNNVNTGMYLLQITSEGRSQQLRLVIE